MERKGLTRRQLAVMAAAAVPATPQTAPASAKPEEELKAAREGMQELRAFLRKHRVPILLEPSFVFKP